MEQQLSVKRRNGETILYKVVENDGVMCLNKGCRQSMRVFKALKFLKIHSCKRTIRNSEKPTIIAPEPKPATASIEEEEKYGSDYENDDDIQHPGRLYQGKYQLYKRNEIADPERIRNGNIVLEKCETPEDFKLYIKILERKHSDKVAELYGLIASLSKRQAK